MAEFGADDPIANYVLDADKFKADAVDHRAFLPDKSGERSVFCVAGFTDAEAAAWGQTMVGDVRQPARVIKGWAQFPASLVKSQLAQPLDLRVDEPPPRHGVIVGWPTAKEDQRKLAMFLASKAEPKRWPPPTG